MVKRWRSTAHILRKQIWLRYRKIPKVSAGAGMFQRSFLKRLFLEGLYAEGLIYGGKFALQNRLGKLIVGVKFMCHCTLFALFYFLFEKISGTLSLYHS